MTCGEIIDDAYSRAVFGERRGEVRPDKTRATRDQS